MKCTKHSKVMIIANKLVKQGYTRAAAMVKDWLLVKLPQIETKVSGVAFNNRQKALEHLKRYKPQEISIDLQRENNIHDSNAVAVIATVKNKGSYCMGYLPKGLAKLITPLLDIGKKVESYFNRVKVCKQYESYPEKWTRQNRKPRK